MKTLIKLTHTWDRGRLGVHGRQLIFTAVVRHAEPSTGDMAIILQQRKHLSHLTNPLH